MRALRIALVAATCLAAVVPPAAADGRRGHQRSDFPGSPRFDRHPHHGHHGHRHGFKHHRALPFFVAPSVVLATPFLVSPPPVYAAPPLYTPPVYTPPAVSAAPAPAVPRVVEFPTGRYELRGDGVYSPYAWVWIPNPPVAPPPPPPPTEAPAPSSVTGSPRPILARAVTVYRWTDEQGVTTWTDSLEKVPVRYREQASRLAP